MGKGSCMCGAVAYEFTGEPAVTALCHCTDCQKWSGGAYTSNVVVPRASFKVTQGNTPLVGAIKSYDAVGDSGKINKHFFCSICGSSLYTELEIMADMTCIKAGTLDGGAADFGKVGVEFYTKDRVSFAHEVAGAKQEKVFG
ncbi:hypothetical protein LSUE1_G000843 [Lachnellula suecica]|uniref:CENP-V/GFA domain-containing protein n=1 Tax=Lachnellula suecica TaxID=602035 RepID=A0A8T9CIE5_9HELO|nr:hypothetical protein LSUE1_G000843 [Lachnellula suecica]